MAYTDTETKIIKLIQNSPEISNAEIAELLGISHRTISSHLRSIYAKSGITCTPSSSREARKKLASIKLE